MFSLTSSFRYYLYRGFTDMRKSFNGLSGIVQSKLHRNLMSGEVFIFINWRRDRVKLLRWETGGFILYYKWLKDVLTCIQDHSIQRLDELLPAK
ncbi:hypothetical protein ES705_29436 [subsurface metagenome]